MLVEALANVTPNVSSEHFVKLLGAINTGSGLMITLKVLATPTQLAVAGLVGVTVIVIVCGVPLVFTNVKPLISPVPLDALAVKPVGNEVGLVIAQA